MSLPVLTPPPLLPPVLFKVYYCDHTYSTIRVPVAASVREVIAAMGDKPGSADDLLLVSLSSAGGESSSSGGGGCGCGGGGSSRLASASMPCPSCTFEVFCATHSSFFCLYRRESHFQTQRHLRLLHAQHQRATVCLPEGPVGFFGGFNKISLSMI